jgi:PEP-CTERM motif
MTLRLPPLRLLALFTLGLLPVPRAGAEPIQWSYQGQVVTTGPSHDSNNQPLGPHVLVSTDFSDGTGLNDRNQAQFADVKGSGSGSQAVTAFQLRVSTDFGDATFFKNIHTFNLNYAIRDSASGATGTVSFQGTLDGFMKNTRGGQGWVDVQVGFTGATQKSLTLGGHLFQVSASPFTFLYEPDLAGIKSFPNTSPYQNVPVSVQVSQVSQAPEPSALALAVVGLAGLGARAWRRRKRARAVV